MLKKLFLCLILVLSLAIGSSALACEPDQVCTLIKGSKVIQIMPDRSLRGVTVPDDVEFTAGPELNPVMVDNLNSQTDMDWNEGHMGMIMVDFGQGPTPVILVVKPTDIKDCK